MPQIAIKSGHMLQDGREDVLTEYICDIPDCPNIATHVLGTVRELGLIRVVCERHRPSN